MINTRNLDAIDKMLFDHVIYMENGRIVGETQSNKSATDDRNVNIVNDHNNSGSFTRIYL